MTGGRSRVRVGPETPNGAGEVVTTVDPRGEPLDSCPDELTDGGIVDLGWV